MSRGEVFLMNEWKDPYIPWHYITINTHKKPDEFPDLKDDSYCPCGSGKKYIECCVARMILTE